MAEGTKVRLVRCPKCENLLPELQNLPVYQCGGCGVVLQAKKQSSSDGSLEKSGEVRVKMSSEKLENFPQKGEVANLSDDQEISVRERDGFKLKGGQCGIVSPQIAINSNSSSSSRIENNKVSTENVESSKYDRSGLEMGTGHGGKYRNPSKDKVDNWVVGNDIDMKTNTNRDKSVLVNMKKEIGESKPEIGIASRSRRSGKIPDRRPRVRDGTTPYRRSPIAVAKGVGFSTSPSPDEGPSNYHLNSSHGFGEPIKNQNHVGGLNRVEYLEQDRNELLRKLDVLKDQLSRSCNMSDKPKDRVPVDGRAVPLDPYVGRDTSSAGTMFRSDQAFSQPFLADKHSQRQPYYTHGHEPVPLMSRRDMDMQNFYSPLMHASDEIPGYGDPFGPQMFGRAPNQLPCQYPQQSFPDHFSEPYMDVDPGYVASYPHNTFFHLPRCSCLNCYNKNCQVPAQFRPAVRCNRRFNDSPTNLTSSHLRNPATFGPLGYEPQPRARRQSELDFETGGFSWGNLQRVTLARRKRRHRRPIAGGAPFITCHNCFKLLPLLRKILLMDKDQRKICCGSCFTVMSLLVESKRVVVSSVINYVSDVAVKGSLHSHGYANQSRAYSVDYENSGHNFQSMSTEPILSSMDQRKKLSKTQNMPGLLSSSSSTLEDEESPGSVTAQREVVLTKATSRENSVKDASMETEMDISFNNYQNTEMCQDCCEIIREEDQPRISKGGDSFLVGLFKKSYRDFSKFNHEHEKSSVSINGHPIPEWLVNKAEKQAGSIHPGQYWYDFRAGFWGVMGEPCMGMIPPFIEEFNYPMLKNCSGGNTGVLVNGRELCKTDLDLLARRGLPTAREKSYIIEISGRVMDEVSGEELDCLGKLAPTVERVKHGFGMHVQTEPT